MRDFNELPCILTCTGYGGTGSSAGTNILEEFSSVLSFGNAFECTFIHEVDGIRDLEKALDEGHRLKVDLACKRFLNLVQNLSKQTLYKEYFAPNFYEKTLQYLNSIGIIEYKGLWHRAFDANSSSRIDKFRQKFSTGIFNTLYKNKICNTYEPDGWTLHYCPIISCYYGNKQEDFYKKTKSYISSLLQLEKLDNKYVLIDQLLPSYDIFEYSSYFYKIKTIVIDRDPRDLYALSKAEWGARFIPTQNVDIFIKWYRETRFSRKIYKEADNLCLFMNFEELIYEYNASLEKIMNFIGLSSSEHTRKLQYFDPQNSIKNTQVYKRYEMLKEDIKRIEIELSEFCFDFEKYPRLDIQVYPKNYILTQDIYNVVDNFQLNGKISKRYKKGFFLYIFKCTKFYDVFSDFKTRTTLKKKIKGIIKLVILFSFLPFEIIETFFHLLFNNKIT